MILGGFFCLGGQILWWEIDDETGYGRMKLITCFFLCGGGGGFVGAGFCGRGVGFGARDFVENARSRTMLINILFSYCGGFVIQVSVDGVGGLAGGLRVFSWILMGSRHEPEWILDTIDSS